VESDARPASVAVLAVVVTAGTTPYLPEVLRAVAEQERAHEVGAAGEQRVDPRADRPPDAAQPRGNPFGFARHRRVRKLRGRVRGHAVSPEVLREIERAGVRRALRRPQVPFRLNPLADPHTPERGRSAAKVQPHVVGKRLTVDRGVRQPARQPPLFGVHKGVVRDGPSELHRIPRLDGGLSVDGERHTRRAEEQPRGHDERAEAAAADPTDERPRKQQRGRAAECQPQRQRAPLRDDRADAETRRKQHQRSAIERAQRQREVLDRHRQTLYRFPGTAISARG